MINLISFISFHFLILEGRLSPPFLGGVGRTRHGWKGNSYSRSCHSEILIVKNKSFPKPTVPAVRVGFSQRKMFLFCLFCSVFCIYSIYILCQQLFKYLEQSMLRQWVYGIVCRISKQARQRTQRTLHL